MSLNLDLCAAEWQLTRVSTGESFVATVPGCVHTDLQSAGYIPDPFWGRNEDELQWIEEEDWAYATTFDLSAAALSSEHLELVADGLDTIATLTLNGREIGKADNMFHAHRFDIHEVAREHQNELVIHFHNPMTYIRDREGKHLEPVACDRIGGRYQIRKQQCSFGWDWGPRFATSGIYRPIRIETWNACRYESFHLTQSHRENAVDITLDVELLGNTDAVEIDASLTYEGKAIVSQHVSGKTELTLTVDNPRLWWPNGSGDQPVYTLDFTVKSDKCVLASRTQHLGLCTVILDQHEDEWGKSFQFVVNGLPIFAKGANWIPTHSFVNEGVALYDDLLHSAKDGWMNMIRVWGGGIYEFDEFYEACLKHGLLVWQDFMFACCLYPGDEAFLNQVQREAIYQVKRVRNWSNLALWCGNNEIEMMCMHMMKDDVDKLEAYQAVFHKMLPQAVKLYNPQVAYWPSSSHNPGDWQNNANNVESGDVHFWGVWHSRQPVEAYEQQFHRFFSEFGMQAYPCVETARTFTESTNLFGPEMDNHQKNGGGNQTIFHYISTLYQFPKDYEATVYLSQINQAFCIRFGIEHMRRNMPRTMGAIYWQINDCWPVASWSSIDFGGRWKALHWAARRFFAPALVSVKRLGKEDMHVSSNMVFSSINELEIWSVYDGPNESKGTLSWGLWRVSVSEQLDCGSMDVALINGESHVRKTLDLSQQIEKYGRWDLVLRTELTCQDAPTSRNTTFLAAPKRCTFRQPTIHTEIVCLSESEDRYKVTFSSDTITYQLKIGLPDACRYRATDNYFDLFPGETHEVEFCLEAPMAQADFVKVLCLYSYVDSYNP